MRRRFSSGDYADYLRILFLDIGMGHEDDQDFSNQTHRLPALLSIDDALRDADGEWIFKNELGGFETDLVLCRITPVLLLIPGKSHDRSYIIVDTIMYVQLKIGDLVCRSWRSSGCKGNDADRGDGRIFGCCPCFVFELSENTAKIAVFVIAAVWSNRLKSFHMFAMS